MEIRTGEDTGRLMTPGARPGPSRAAPLKVAGLLIGGLVLSPSACSDGAPSGLPDETPEAAEIAILAAGARVEVFDSLVLVAAVRAADGTLVTDPELDWSVLNDSLASIGPDGGLVGRAIGEVEVVATVGGLADTARVAVVAPREAVLSLSRESVLMGEGGRLQLEATLAMPDGREVPGAILEWSVSDARVLDVSAEGVVTAGGIGTGRVHVRSVGRLSGTDVEVTHGWIEVLPSWWHTCALRADGRAYCWGNNRHGRLGIGVESAVDFSRPHPVAGGHRFNTLTVGEHHACGIDLDGSAWCWGRNRFGALGNDGAPDDTFEPVRVDLDRTVRQISAGEDHTCATDRDGLGWCWGRNTSGQVGVAEGFGEIQSKVRTPVRTSSSGALQDLATGSFNSSHGLTRDGRALVWGRHAWQLPEDAIEDERCGPKVCFLSREVPGGLTFHEIMAGYTWSCGRTAPGEVFCWGPGRPEPAPVELGAPARALGRGHLAFVLCALSEDGDGRCWSADGGFRGSFPLGGDLRLRALASSLRSVCGVTPTNVAYCWRSETASDLPEAEPRRIPEPVVP